MWLMMENVLRRKHNHVPIITVLPLTIVTVFSFLKLYVTTAGAVDAADVALNSNDDNEIFNTLQQLLKILDRADALRRVEQAGLLPRILALLNNHPK
jgi:hypothetical protein